MQSLDLSKRYTMIDQVVSIIFLFSFLDYIEKNCWLGIEEYFNSLVKALEEECDRTRKAMASGVVGSKRKVGRRRQNKPLPLPPTIAEEPLIQPLVLPQVIFLIQCISFDCRPSHKKS